MTLKASIYFLSVSAAISAIICLLSMGFSAENTPANAENLQTSEVTECGYVLGFDDIGRLALFRQGSDKPYKILYDYDTSLLTDYDRKLIEEGIVADTPQKLQRIIEDITG